MSLAKGLILILYKWFRFWIVCRGTANVYFTNTKCWKVIKKFSYSTYFLHFSVMPVCNLFVCLSDIFKSIQTIRFDIFVVIWLNQKFEFIACSNTKNRNKSNIKFRNSSGPLWFDFITQSQCHLELRKKLEAIV